MISLPILQDPLAHIYESIGKINDKRQAGREVQSLPLSSKKSTVVKIVISRICKAQNNPLLHQLISCIPRLTKMHIFETTSSSNASCKVTLALRLPITSHFLSLAHIQNNCDSRSLARSKLICSHHPLQGFKTLVDSE